jgi:hypothetical protein
MRILFRHGSPLPIRDWGAGPVQAEAPQRLSGARRGDLDGAEHVCIVGAGQGAGTSGHLPGRLRLHELGDPHSLGAALSRVVAGITP